MTQIMRMIFLTALALLITKDKVEVNSKKGIEEVFLTIILIIKNIRNIKYLQIKMNKTNMTLR